MDDDDAQPLSQRHTQFTSFQIKEPRGYRQKLVDFTNSKRMWTMLAMALVVVVSMMLAVLIYKLNCPGFYRLPKQQTKEALLKFQDNRKSKNISFSSLLMMIEYISLGNHEPEYYWVDFEKQYIEKKYKVSKYVQEIPMCIAITSYNNVQNQRIQYNLKSVFRQQYSNYKIVYLDDASTDGTFQQAKSIFDKYSFDRERLIMKKNEVNKGPLQNHVQIARQYCKPQSVFIILDGDDALQGTQTLKLLNAIYQQKQVWYVYTNYIPIQLRDLGVSNKIPDEVVKSNSYRKYATEDHWITSHMRTFYTQLFLSVPQSAFKFPNGTYFKTAVDRAEVYPMHQMAQQKFVYVPELTYIYVDNTDNSVWRTKYQKTLQIVELLGTYPIQSKLSCLFKTKNNQCIPSNQLVHRMDQYEPTNLPS